MEHQSLQGKKSYQGEPLELATVQALKVDLLTFGKVQHNNATALILKGIQHFKAEPAILCSNGIYIDITIKQIRHTNGFDLTKDERIKADVEYFTNDLVTFVELERT